MSPIEAVIRSYFVRGHSIGRRLEQPGLGSEELEALDIREPSERDENSPEGSLRGYTNSLDPGGLKDSNKGCPDLYAPGSKEVSLSSLLKQPVLEALENPFGSKV